MLPCHNLSMVNQVQVDFFGGWVIGVGVGVGWGVIETEIGLTELSMLSQVASGFDFPATT